MCEIGHKQAPTKLLLIIFPQQLRNNIVQKVYFLQLCYIFCFIYISTYDRLFCLFVIKQRAHLVEGDAYNTRAVGLIHSYVTCMQP